MLALLLAVTMRPAAALCVTPESTTFPTDGATEVALDARILVLDPNGEGDIPQLWSETGDPVAATVSWSHSPGRDSYAIVQPEEALSPGAVYRLTYEGAHDALEMSFSTGEASDDEPPALPALEEHRAEAVPDPLQETCDISLSIEDTPIAWIGLRLAEGEEPFRVEVEADPSHGTAATL